MKGRLLGQDWYCHSIIKTPLTNCVNDNRPIGRYCRNYRLIPIIGKTADNRPIPIIGASLVGTDVSTS